VGTSREWNGGTVHEGEWRPATRVHATYRGQQVKVLRMRVCRWTATGSPVQARQFQEFEIELPDETRTIMHEDGLGSRPSSLGSSVSGPP
jgi:hypothetical protein